MQLYCCSRLGSIVLLLVLQFFQPIREDLVIAAYGPKFTGNPRKISVRVNLLYGLVSCDMFHNMDAFMLHEKSVPNTSKPILFNVETAMNSGQVNQQNVCHVVGYLASTN